VQRREVGGFHDQGANVHDAVEPPRRPANLDVAEAGCSGGVGVGGRGENVADEEPDGADEVVAEGADGVDGDGDSGGVAGEELRRDAEEELVVPGRVVAADLVDSGSELGGGVDPCEGVGLEPPPWRRRWLQSLC